MTRHLITGDIVFFQDDSFISRSIRLLSRSHNEPKTYASHVGVMYNDKLICESVERVRIGPITGTNYQVFRYTALTDAQKSEIISYCNEMQGKRYGYLKILAHFGDSLLGNRYFFRRLALLKDYPICSWLVAFAFECVAPNFFGIRPNIAQPDCLYDYCVANPELFRKVNNV